MYCSLFGNSSHTKSSLKRKMFSSVLFWCTMAVIVVLGHFLLAVIFTSCIFLFCEYQFHKINKFGLDTYFQSLSIIITIIIISCKLVV